MRRLLHVVRIALLVVLALPVAGLAQSALVVTPGLGIGQWTLDGKLANYVWVSGEVNLLNGEDVPLSDVRANGTDPQFSQQLDEKSWRSPNRIFVVYPPTSNAISALGSTEPAAQTIEHVGIGSTQDQVAGAYSAPTFVQQLPLRSRTLIYDGRGVAFEFVYQRTTAQFGPGVARVWVFRPGQARAIWRLP
ncbi:MAG TPA: hypothetical protein VKW09_06355 [bacterium]|nr:hypothetical protein [bacterium]